jgi:hypothetical protein
MTMNEIKLHATSLARHGYGKGWQVNALIDGVESEMTCYGVSKVDALATARRTIARDGRLPHEPYKAADAIFKGFKVSA